MWLPSWGLHGPAALDLAVTSGLRSGALPTTAVDGARPCLDYEARKRAHQDTARLCGEAGLQFIPLVAEACGGGWGPTAVQTWRTLGSLIAARIGLSGGLAVEQLLQSLSVALQRENGRAVLRRMPCTGEAAQLLPLP